MHCPRGFILVRNMRTGDIRPFFVKVREEDIIRAGETEAAQSDRVTFSYTNSNWLIEEHDVFFILNMSTIQAPSELTLVSTRIAEYTITLPEYVYAASSAILITKYSGANSVFENCNVEADFQNINNLGMSRTVRIRFIDANGRLTAANIINVNGLKISINIKGFSDNPSNYEE